MRRKISDELDRFFTIALDLFCIASSDGYFLWLNPAWEHALGFTLSELKLRQFFDHIHPEDLASTRQAMATLIAQKEVINFSNRYCCKDGSYRWFEWRATTMGDRIYASARDITERKLQDRERLVHLKFFESMDRINRAIQGTNDLEEMMDHVLGTVHEIFHCDRAWLLYPCDPEAPSWRVPMERSRPEYGNSDPTRLDIPMDPVASAILRTMRAASGPVKAGPGYQHKVSEGFQIESQISMAIYPKIGRAWLFGLHQCSYERMWTPEEERLFQEISGRLCDALTGLLTFRDLQKSEEKYREVFNNVSDSLTLLDIAEDGRFLLADMNPVAEKIFGISKAKAQGQFFEDALSSELAEHYLPLFHRCIEIERQLSSEHWIESTPVARFLRTVLLPVRNGAGSIYRLIALCSDLTERKAVEQRMHLLMSEVNHRAKNMLTVVQAIARQTATTKPDDFIDRFGERIHALAASQDLLVKSEWKGVDLDELARSHLAHFGDLVGTRIELCGPSLILSAPAAQTIGMALHELATNAGKYGALAHDNGRVEIEWRVEGANTGEQSFVIGWREHGVHSITVPSNRGFGSTVICEMAEMSLSAKVELDFPATGLTWRLRCPLAHVLTRSIPTLVDEKEKPDDSPPLTDTRPRILVVEDEALVAIEIAHMLRTAGFEVLGPARTVYQALRLLNEAGCDAAVLDINLGGETSEPVALGLIERGTPFVTVSGYSKEQHASAFKNARSLAKPLRAELLISELRRCMAQPKERAALAIH